MFYNYEFQSVFLSKAGLSRPNITQEKYLFSPCLVAQV